MGYKRSLWGTVLPVSTQAAFTDSRTQISTPDVKSRAEYERKPNGSFSCCWEIREPWKGEVSLKTLKAVLQFKITIQSTKKKKTNQKIKSMKKYEFLKLR